MLRINIDEHIRKEFKDRRYIVSFKSVGHMIKLYRF